MKSNKGITLIAIIITIIVMTILVGVTVAISTNSGLIEKAKDAKTQTQFQADKEELQMAVASAIDYATGVVNRGELEDALSGWTVSSGDAPYTCTSASENVFTVSANGGITEQ